MPDLQQRQGFEIAAGNRGKEPDRFLQDLRKRVRCKYLASASALVPVPCIARSDSWCWLFYFAMKDFAENFYKSRVWQNNRAAYAKSAHGLCEDCLELGEIVPGDIVHHMVELTPENINDPEIAMAWSNLRLVCRDHHRMRHKVTGNRRYAVGPGGSIRLRDLPPL